MNRQSIDPAHPGLYTGCMAEMKVLLSFVGNREQAAQLLGLQGPAFRKALRERFGDLVEEQ